MPSDVEWIAEVRYAVESAHQIHGDECLCGYQSTVARYRSEHMVSVTIEALIQAGFGHIPTALHQAADDTPREWLYGPKVSAGEVKNWLRARADRAGGNDE